MFLLTFCQQWRYQSNSLMPAIYGMWCWPLFLFRSGTWSAHDPCNVVAGSVAGGRHKFGISSLNRLFTETILFCVISFLVIYAILTNRQGNGYSYNKIFMLFFTGLLPLLDLGRDVIWITAHWDHWDFGLCLFDSWYSIASIFPL